MTAHSTKGRGDSGLPRSKAGFTLIELLVVIAIIGLLSSVVLASLNSARNKGADAAIKSQLKSLQSQAEIIYDGATPNSYEGVCEDANVISQVTAAGNAGGATTIAFTDATAPRRRRLQYSPRIPISVRRLFTQSLAATSRDPRGMLRYTP